MGDMHNILDWNGGWKRQGLRHLWRTELRFSAAALRSVAQSGAGDLFVGKKLSRSFSRRFTDKMHILAMGGFHSVRQGGEHAQTSSVGTRRGSDRACDISNGLKRGWRKDLRRWTAACSADLRRVTTGRKNVPQERQHDFLYRRMERNTPLC